MTLRFFVKYDTLIPATNVAGICIASVWAERQQEELNMKQKRNIRRMTELALLMAIVLLMAFTPLGYLMTPWGIQITFIVIPVAVGSIVLGPGAGAFLGLVFGLTSFAKAFETAIGILMLESSVLGTFVVSVIPRVLVGLLPGLLYRGLHRFSGLRTASQAVCCFLTPVINTALYMGASWLIFADIWLQNAVAAGYQGATGLGLLAFMLGMVAVNGVAEAIACLILGTAVCRALIHALHRNE